MGIRRIFADESIPLIDDSKLVPDSGFADYVRANVDGEPLIHHALISWPRIFSTELAHCRRNL